ncbi:MAG: hypothetical protein V4857_29400 [Pseudomonadota bacterium]
MHRHLSSLCAALLLLCVAPILHAHERPSVALTVDVSHVGKDKWLVDYRFQSAVTSITLPSVGEYRQKAWKLLTPGLRLKTAADNDVISRDGKPFKAVSVEITTFDGLAPKAYAPFNRFTDGGTAMFLGLLQGEAHKGQHAFAMSTDVRLKGLAGENVIAPPLNKLTRGGERGYAYFGPAQAVSIGNTKFLLDPQTPAWSRETMLDVGAKMSQYYEKAYQRPLKDELFIMLSVAGYEAPGISIKGDAVMGQLSYRFDGKELLGDHPKKRELLTRLVAHEMAHLWQLNIERGGVGEDDPWIHEGGAEAMALDGLLNTGLLSQEKIAAYRKAQTATCEKLGNSVATYDGIYACGLVRFDKLGVAIVPLWRSMIEATEAKGEVYSQQMIDAIVGAKTGTQVSAQK